MDRDAQDVDVPVEQSRALQLRLNNRIEEISFDGGFHSPENQTELAKIVPLVCLPKKGKHQAAKQDASATDEFRRARRRHSGVEAAIGALQAGNGLKRCRDKTEIGFERYLALGVFGRNLHTLGKLLIAREDLDRTFAQVTRSVSEDGAGFRLKSSLTLRVTMVELLAFFAKVRSRPTNPTSG